MKRRLSILMAFCLLLLSCLSLVPAGAAEGADAAWAQLSYKPVVAEDEPAAEAVALKPDQRTPVTGAVEILFDAEASIVLMNNQRIEPGKTVEKAGEYRFQVYDASTYIEGGVNPNLINYVIEYAPNLIVKNGENETKLVNGAVYQYYPTLLCDNARKIEITRGTNVATYSSGDSWPFPGEFGEFTVSIYGEGTGGSMVKVRTYTFRIHPCVASKSYNELTGLYTLQVTVGSFADIDFDVVLDGKEQIEGGTTKAITTVGRHTLDLKVNGEAVNRELYNYYGMPSADDLSLMIEVELDSDVFDAPRSFDFSRWDATIELDGEVVSGEIYIDGHGEHTLRALDRDGNAIEQCFLIKVGEAAPAVADQLTVTFDNPHFLYVIFMAIPAALLLIAAVGFLILRRIIV